jgi:hypothetical protein
MSFSWTRCVGFDSTNTMCPPRNFHTTNIVGDNAYIIGGTSGQQFFADVKKIKLKDLNGDASTPRWDIPSLRQGPGIPVADGSTFAGRSRHTAVTIGTNIYVFGGVKGGDDLYRLDTSVEPLIWNKVVVAGRKPSSRLGHTATAIQSNMYLFGGTNGSTDFNDLYEFNSINGHWNEISNISGVPPKASGAYSMHPLKNNLVIIGSVRGESTMVAYMVNLVGEKRWWELSSFRKPYNAPRKRHLFSATAMYNNDQDLRVRKSGNKNELFAQQSSSIRSRNEPKKIIIFGGTIGRTTGDAGLVSDGITNEMYMLEFHEDTSYDSLGATAEFRIRWVQMPCVGNANSKDAVSDTMALRGGNLKWKSTPCPRIGHTMVYFPGLTRYVRQRKFKTYINNQNSDTTNNDVWEWTPIPTHRIYIFGGSDRKTEFGDLYFGDLEPALNWQLHSKRLSIPKKWPTSRIGCTLTPLVPQIAMNSKGQLKTENDEEDNAPAIMEDEDHIAKLKNAELILLLGGLNMEDSKSCLKTGKDSVGISNKQSANATSYILYRQNMLTNSDINPAATDPLEWSAMEISNKRSLKNSPLTNLGSFHGHTVTAMYDEKSVYKPANKYSCSFLVFGGITNGTNKPGGFYHLEIDCLKMCQQSLNSLAKDSGKWCKWKHIQLESKSNSLGLTRMGHAAIAIGKFYFIIGGYSDDQYQPSAIAMNTGSSKLRWRSLRNKTFARVGHSVVVSDHQKQEALLFGGISDGIFMNDLYTILLAKEEDGKDKDNSNSKSFRGRTKRFVLNGGSPPSPRYGHSAIILDQYQGGQWKDADSTDSRGASSILPSFDTDVESETEGRNEDYSKRIKAINNTYHSSPKMIIIGGFVDPTDSSKTNRINHSKKGDLIVDVSCKYSLLVTMPIYTIF